jgi:hypothetical protein
VIQFVNHSGERFGGWRGGQIHYVLKPQGKYHFILTRMAKNKKKEGKEKKKFRQQQVLAKLWNSRKLYILLVGV